jgi:hypothetical protein
MLFKRLFPSVLFAVFFSQAIGVPSGALQGDSVGVHPHYNPEVLYEVRDVLLDPSLSNWFSRRLMARVSRLPLE